MNDNHKTNSKIKGLEELAVLLSKEQVQGKKVILCHGVFDLLHIGHIRHFEQAKKFGDVLAVTTTPDHYVNKGPGRPVFNEALRAEAIAALDYVDYVAINDWPTAVETIRLLAPDFYIKGSDYSNAAEDRTGGIALEEAAVQSVGGQIAFTNEITFSSSNLINQHLPVLGKEISDYLASFSSKFSADSVIRYLEQAQSLKVLVVGETIIDEYVYCETLGKSGKEPILAIRQINSERFAGGVVAVANHIAAFCDKVELLTFLGQVESQENFICENLSDNVETRFLYMEENAPTIIKRRFVETYPFQKMFELYVMDEGESKPAETKALCGVLEELLPKYDAVVVTDYGHGMLGPEAVDVLCDKAKFLAVNTQANAGNLGFNTVSKYPRADFLSVSEKEIRLDARSRRKDLRLIVEDVAQRLSCERMIITRGQGGCLCYGREEGFLEVPALSSQVVDRMGAGDAVFSIAGLCAAQKAPMELVGFVGSVAGAQAVGTIGHRESLQRSGMSRHIETLLK